MATLIPLFSACKSRMTGGEKRLAERLLKKLDPDYLVWYDVPIGPKRLHPDFVVLHPRRGLLILEVKDWQLKTIVQADKNSFELLIDGQPKTVANPAEQARQYAHQVVNTLERDAQLVQTSGNYQGKLMFAWSYGVVLSNITRAQFEQAQLGLVLEPKQVICKDEMHESVTEEDLQSRLWDMFAYVIGTELTATQVDRVRWILFPQVRVPTAQAPPQSLFDEPPAESFEWPALMRAMDVRQEQLARGLGDGHRVIHGVAGSGKTMVLLYRAEQLARALTPQAKPILVLCYNEPLAVKLASVLAAKGLGQQVQTVHFHKWCRQQLVKFKQALPPEHLSLDEKMVQMVQNVIDAVAQGQIPTGQYQALLLDEGHDFAPEWLQLVSQMVDPATQSLLLLYDGAQSIYPRYRKAAFSFKSVGIEAQGRSTVLKINYRNTRQILHTARLIASGLLTQVEQQDIDGVPLIDPVSCGRDGPEPLIVELPNVPAEARHIAVWLKAAHQQGHAWRDMAVIAPYRWMLQECAQALQHAELPHQVRDGTGTFRPEIDSIKLLTMHASKGLEFAVVALMGVGQMPGAYKNEHEEARLFYVGATRAMQQLTITLNGGCTFAKQLSRPNELTKS